MSDRVNQPARPSDPTQLDLIRRGRSRLSVELRDGRDRLIASDPGGSRIRQGIRAVVAVGTTLAIEYGVALALGVPPLLNVMIGAVTAMLLATAIRENHRRTIVITALGAPVAAAVGATSATVIVGWKIPSLIGFVVISFIAVWVRRFGPRWFTYGFLTWQAYFFCLFLQPPVAALPLLLLGIIVGVLWVVVLLVTVFWDDPAARLRRTVDALRARARAGVSAAIDVLTDPDDPDEVRKLRTQLVRLSEVALLFDGQLSEALALPADVSPSRLRRWVVDVEVAMDELVNAVISLANREDGMAAPANAAARRALTSIGWGELADAETSVRRLVTEAGDDRTVHRLADAASMLLRVVDEWQSGRLAPDDEQDDQPGPPDPLDAELDPYEVEAMRGFRDDTFQPVVTLMSGNLPGSAALATDALVDDEAPWWSPARLKLNTRQAIQASVAAAVAIVAGELISPQRYYWAVITAFIVFTGTTTSGETVRKSLGRIAGTALGLVAAILLANLTAGSPVASMILILACIFVGFYFQQLSPATMIFCITIMLGQMYGLLHTFSDALLLLRLEETAAGGLAGALTALIVLPASTRVTLRQSRRAFLTTLGDLLAECSLRLGGDGQDRDLLSIVVGLDADSRQIVQTARSMIRGRLFGAGRAGLRHRLAVLGSCSATGRVIAWQVVAALDSTEPDLAAACALLAQECRRLAEIPDLGIQPARPPSRDDVSVQVADLLDAAGPTGLPELATRLRRLADTLGLLTPRGRGS